MTLELEITTCSEPAVLRAAQIQEPSVMRMLTAAFLLLSCPLSAAAGLDLTFRVSFAEEVRAESATGRLVVYLIREGAAVAEHAVPADGPFWDDPQPMFGRDVTDLAPGAVAVVDDSATSFPHSPSELGPGRYTAQAVLDIQRHDSDWRREPGNLYSDPVAFTIEEHGADLTVTLDLTRTVEPRVYPDVAGVEIVEVRSELLSSFRGCDVYLRAGVVRPLEEDPDRRYAAVYEVPGFGGDHAGAFDFAARVAEAPAGSPARELARHAYRIVLDPEGPNGHHLFADSANNGPVGEALVAELLPALESRFGLIAEPFARLLRGHSSGGWSAIWLALTYPETFGAAWSTSPDPVTFHRFQLVDIYGWPSMYFWDRELHGEERAGREIPSYRALDGTVKVTIREENRIEQVLGEDQTSAQQWHSWMAVFGPRSERGNPAALFDAATGTIDRAVAARYRAFDIAERVRKVPGEVGILFPQRIRLIMGDRDSYYLELAARLLEEELAKLQFLHYPEGQHGSIRFLEGHDHFTIHGAPEVLAIPAEMLDHLRRHGFIG